jgi:hypothetical protein
VAAHAAVGVHDDLAAGDAAVPLRPAHHEAAGGVDEVLRLLVEELRRNRGLDHLLQDVLADGLDGHEPAVLGGHDDGVHADRPVALVLDRDLALAVGPQVVDDALAADLGEPSGQPVGQHDRAAA